MRVSVVSAIARSAGRSTASRETNSATRCCASAAEPPLPHTISLCPDFIALAVRLPASTTASWMDSSFSTEVIVATDWLSCFLTRSLMMALQSFYSTKQSMRLQRRGGCPRSFGGGRLNWTGRLRGKFEPDALLLDCVWALLNLGINRTDVFADNAEKHQYQPLQKEHADDHGGDADRERLPENEF